MKKQTLHKFLFPSFHNRIEQLKDDCADLSEENSALLHKNQGLIKQVQDHVCEKPKFTVENISDLIGSMVLDFVNVDKDGEYLTFLKNVDKDKRVVYITQLAQIWNLEAFHAMIDSHINEQGNFIARKALDDLQMFCGRMIIKGVAGIRREVKTAFDEFTEGRNSNKDNFKEGSDESFEMSEGIPLETRSQDNISS